eukprot:6213133-Pleurochrysis_carterae.AAC.7
MAIGYALDSNLLSEGQQCARNARTRREARHTCTYIPARLFCGLSTSFLPSYARPPQISF